MVVLSEKVETTVQKGIFRAAGTVFGGAIGYAAMLRTQSATSPVLLVVVLCVWVFFGSWLALKTEVDHASKSLAPAALVSARRIHVSHSQVAYVVAFALHKWRLNSILLRQSDCTSLPGRLNHALMPTICFMYKES